MRQHPLDPLQWLLDELRQENPSTQAAEAIIDLISKIVCKYHSIPSKDQQDVVMKAATRVYLQRDAFAGKSKIWGWVYGITRNIVLEHLRDQGEEPVALESIADALPDPINLEDAALSQMAAEEALGTLTVEERRIMELHLDGLNYNEIGEHVARSGNNVGKILRFSVARKLGKHLQNEGWMSVNSSSSDKGSKK